MSERELIPWTGNTVKGPLPQMARVTLKFRAGDIHKGCTAGDYSWEQNGDPDDIVAYAPE